MSGGGTFGPWGPGIGLGLPFALSFAILLAITLTMTLPISRTRRWGEYRRPLYVTAVLAENWIVVVGLVLIFTAPVGIGSPLKAVAFFGAITVFWGFTIILASPRIQSRFIPEMGLFRPDLIYPTGAQLARGEIFAGLGLKLMVTVFPNQIANWSWLPVWNWWGLLWAVVAMVLLVAVRGMTKVRVVLMGRMLFGRMRGWRGILLEEGLLVVGFFALAYGFLNVFMGYAPFTVVYPRFWPGALLILAAALILIPLRGHLKHKVDRITMSHRRALGLMALLYVGVLILLYGMIALFMGRWLGISSPLGLALGLYLQVLAFSVIVLGRSYSLMHDKKGMLPQMLWAVSYADEAQIQNVMAARLKVFAQMDEPTRLTHMSNMFKALSEIPEDRRRIMLSSQVRALATVETAVRERCMRTMDRVMLTPGAV